MGWFEYLSGSNKSEGARKASVAERIERCRYLAHHSPPKDGESLQWEGNLFTGYHFRKGKGKPDEYIEYPD
jgi:hypothetical protein